MVKNLIALLAGIAIIGSATLLAQKGNTSHDEECGGADSRCPRVKISVGIAGTKGRLSPAAEKFWQYAKEAASKK